MDLQVRIDGLDRLAAKSRRLEQDLAKELQIGLFASAKRIEGDAKRSILDGQKSGRIYRRGNVVHRASAPGEAPASDTGRLVNSINAIMQGTLTAIIKAGGGIVKYARMLEFGTARIAARPFFQPAVEGNRGWIANRMREAVNRALKRGGK